VEGHALIPDRLPAEGAAVPWPGEVTLHLARSRRTLHLAPGRNLLAALLGAGVRLRHACHSGSCGACETRVLAGQPCHRDPELGTRRPLPTDRIRPCVSPSASAELTLDL
jgi:vanillate O-demethylase ferredoxin subunit